MTGSSRVLRGVIAIALAIGMVPGVSWAVENQPTDGADVEASALSQSEETQPAETPIVPEESEEKSTDTADVRSIEEETERASEEGIQPLNGVQEGPQVLEEGDFGENNALHWVYKDDASLTISGAGVMPDYAKDGGQPWNAYLRTVESLTIGEGIIAVGAYAFYECDLLGKGEITLPSTLLSIGGYAFANCDYFTEIEIHDGLERIGEYAFYACTKLERIMIPDTVTTIGAHAFEKASRLVECHLPASLTVIENDLFHSCGRLKRVNIPDGVTTINSYAFAYSGTKESLVFPASLTTIGPSAFGGITVDGSVHIPASITTLGSSAFLFFKVLGTLSFDEGVLPSVFSGVAAVGGATSESWTAYTVEFPASLNTKLYWSGPLARDSYEVKEGNQYYAAVDGVLYSTGGKYDNPFAVLQSCPFSCSGDLTVPEGVKEVPSGSIPRAIKRINLPTSLETFSATAFDQYASIQYIEVAEGNPVYGSRDGVLFTSDFKELILRPRCCTVNNDYIVPSTVEVIDAAAFAHNINLRSVSFPEGLIKIPNNCIYDCGKLISIYIPSSVKTIDAGNFYAVLPDGRLGRNVFYGGTEDEWDAVSKNTINNDSLAKAKLYFEVAWSGVCDDGLLCYIDSERTLNITIDERSAEPGTTMKDYSIGEAVWHSVIDRFDSVAILQSVESVGANAFNGCGNIQSASIGWNVKKVSSAAFLNCVNLQTVNCLGYPFEVVSANEDDASFDAMTVELSYQSGVADWLNAPAYDAGTKKWNGYALVEGEAVDLPILGSVSVTYNGNPLSSIAVDGCTGDISSWGGMDQTCPIVVTAEDGSDITDKVDITVVSPSREYPLTDSSLSFAGNVFLNLNRSKSMDVSYDSVVKVIKIGRCSPAGVHKIVITPKEFQTAGEALEYPITVTRSQERYFDCMVVSPVATSKSGLAGRYKETDDPYVATFEVCNQYMESVTSRVDPTVIDELSNEDVTDQLPERGLLFPHDSAGMIEIDKMAQPRDYTIKLSDPSGVISGSISRTLKLARDSRYLEVPYSVDLMEGPDEIEVEAGADGVWSSTSYRVRVLDAFDDPCWPTLGWTVTDDHDVNVTSDFKVDDQGYVFVSADVIDRLGANDTANYDVRSSAMGWNNSQRQSDTRRFTVKVKQPDPEPVTHTATFKVGEDVIGQVVFEEGDTSLEEPALPIRENYIGEWEEYDLAGQTSDFVVQGVYSPMDPDKVSEVAGGVDAEYDNGLVNISISAAAATKNIKVESNNTKPLDAVMVLDRSGSMNDDNKLEKLKQCAEQFAQSLYENAEKTGADHRIALVGFAYGNVSSGSYNRSGYENSGLLTTASGSARTFQEICSQGCSDALLPINDGGAINGNIINAINTMTANGATAADVGLDIARRVFADSPDRIDANGNVRERVAIFITDGVPTSFYATDYRQVTETAAQAITMANVIKQGQGARIYSIGVDANASAEAAFNSAADGAITRGSGSNRTVQSYDFNRFLHAVSSNYPNAAAMSNLGDGDKAAGYYMAANDTSSLDKIFTNILYSTVYSIQSFDRATLTYKLPAGLVLTMKDEEAMRASLAQQGMLDEDIEVVRDGDSTTLVFRNVKVKREAVNGINQYVARVSFQVSVDGGVSGEVLAGAGASAEIGGQATDIEVPTVNIPADRRLIVFKINGEVYEIRDAQVGDAITLPETDIARWLDLEKQENPVVKEGDAYVVFETSTLERAYTMKWIANGTVVTETHAFGEELSIPSGIGSAVPEGMEISHWSPSLPQTMPARNVTCTAVLTPVHVHAYQADSYTTGSCTEGLTIHQVCSCGEEQTSQNAPKDHAYKAYLSSAGQYSTTVEKLVCEDCGHSVSKNITYQVSKSSRWPNLVVLELDKYENEVLQSGPSDDDITIRFYVGDEMDGTYNVYRIDENGVQDTFKGTVENGYLSFAPDHFSDYVIGPISESGEDDAPTYEQVKDIKANPDLPAMDPDDEENAGNDDGNNGDGDNENNGSNNGDDNNDNPDDNANTNDGNGNNSNNGQDTSDNNDALKENDPENRGDGTIAQPEEVDPADSLPTEYGAPLRPTQLESVLADTGDDQVQWIWCLSCAALLAVALVGFLGVRRLRRMKR